MNTLERDLATVCKATGGRPPVQTGEGEPESPAAERGVGAPNRGGVCYLLAGSQAWHAQAKAAAGQMLAVATGLRMALPTSGQAVEVANVAPDLARVTAAHEELGRQYPAHRLRAAAMDTGFVEAVEHSSQGSAGRSSAQGSRGGGGVALPLTSGPRVPSNLHGYYLCIFIYEYMYMQVLPATPPPWAV